MWYVQGGMVAVHTVRLGTRNSELRTQSLEFISVVWSMADGLRETCGALWISIPTQTGFPHYTRACHVSASALPPCAASHLPLSLPPSASPLSRTCPSLTLATPFTLLPTVKIKLWLTWVTFAVGARWSALRVRVGLGEGREGRGRLLATRRGRERRDGRRTELNEQMGCY